ncbi:MAG TPA: SDR family oxidoreductase [Phycisphaerae bacterium]|nr:SDR family oxidoreductase [Phycisphaerae bacterium]
MADTAYLNEMFGLDGKRAAVIGGGGVLAGAMSSALARAGAKVAILDLNPEAAQRRCDAIRQAGGEAMALKVDVACRDDLVAACGQIDEAWGGTDILINAPGVNSGTPFFEITESEWEMLIAIDLKGVFLACQVFGRGMVERRGGSIINISSASSGPPLSKVFTYAVAKGGVNQVTQFLAREWATDGVRVNALIPGFFPAEQNRKLLTPERNAQIMNHTPMKRFGAAEELLGAVLWLASGKASGFVTGALVRVDGGFAAMTI